MAFKVLKPAGGEAAAAPASPKFRVIKPAAKRGMMDDVVGGLDTLYRSVPGLDEVNDGLRAGVDTARDIFSPEYEADVRARLADPTKGRPADASRDLYRQNLAEQRARSKGSAAEFEAARPVAANLTKGVGLAAQVVPALMTGGASAAPTAVTKAPAVAKVTDTVARRVARALAPKATVALKAATAGGLGAQVTGLAGEGDLSERVADANEMTIPAMVVGAALPSAVGAADFVRRKSADALRGSASNVARVANRATGGKLLDPTREASVRLGDALEKDGLDPAAIRTALDEWQSAGGPSPAFLDLIARNGGGQRTMALIRGSAMTGGGRDVASRYGNQVAVDLPDEAISRTRGLTSDGRNLPDLDSDIAGRIATNSQAPRTTAGRGGAMVSGRLNREFDTANARVGAAYNQAREAAPDAAFLPAAERPRIAASVREAVRDYDPLTVPAVSRELSRLDDLRTVTVRDLFEARQRLGTLRVDGGVESRAAGSAVRALDAQIDDAAERGLIGGDPEAVNLWRQAIGERRKMGQEFQGDDLIQTLTERTSRGGGRTNAVAPDDASNVILGRGGVSNRQDITRDLTRLRDRLGADSPEWRELQDEGVARILGKDAGGENYGAAWGRFADENPDLSRLLMSPQTEAALSKARTGISDAVADRGAVGAGRAILNTPSADYAARVAGAGERRPLVQTAAARGIEDNIERIPEGATGLLNRIATARRSGNNLETTFGPDEAARYRKAIGQMVDQVRNARFINPNTGSQSAGRLFDEGLVEGSIPTSKTGIIVSLVNKLRRGVSLTDGERQAIVELATRRLDGPEAITAVPVSRRAIPLSPQQRARLAIAASQAQGQQRASSGRR